MRNNNPNNWHYVDITHVSGDTYKWTNRAGVSWTLTKITASMLDDQLEVGTDCPYHKDGHTMMKYMNGGEYVLGPWNQKYYRELSEYKNFLYMYINSYRAGLFAHRNQPAPPPPHPFEMKTRAGRQLKFGINYLCCISR